MRAMIKRIGDRFRRLIPSKEKLEGGRLHRFLGERLFAHDLWHFTRRSVAGGMALGVFIAMTPTIGIHMTAAVLAALVLRVNIPVAVAACWIVNPVNAPFVYYMEYKVGVWLVGAGTPSDMAGMAGYGKMFHSFLGVARPLFFGTLVMGVPAAVLAYALTYFGWGPIARVLARGQEGPTGGDEA